MSRKQLTVLILILGVVLGTTATMVILIGLAIKENKQSVAACVARGGEEVRVLRGGFNSVICAKVEELK